MGESSSLDARDRRWWRSNITAGQRHKVLCKVVDSIRAAQAWRKEADGRRLRMYSTAPAYGYGIANAARPSVISRGRISFNVIKTVGDTFVSMVTKDNPKADFVTEGGDWSLRQKAKGMTKYIEGQVHESRLYERAPQLVRDGGVIFGTGTWHPYIKGKGKSARICVDRVLPSERFVDEQEGLRGPEHLKNHYWQVAIDRLVLEEIYKDSKDAVEAIRRCARATDVQNGMGYETTADQLLVTNAWHLRAGPDASDGRFVRAIENFDLEDEAYEYDEAPFVEYRKEEAPLGFFGIPIADNLDGPQTELNALLIKTQRAMHMLGAAHVLADNAAKINFSQWDNDQGSIIRFTGREPKVYVPPMLVTPEIYAHMDRIHEWAYEAEGIPRPQAMGMTPPETQQSGRSQEVYLQVANRRLKPAFDAYHNVFLKMADWYLRLGREITEKHNTNFGVKAAVDRRTGMRFLKFSDNDLREEEYILKRWPVNALSDEPGTRIADLERLVNLGWITADEAKRAMDYPDLEQMANLANASYDMTEDLIAAMLDDGEYMQPPPVLNLEQAKVQVTQALVKAWKDKRPEDRLQLLRDFLEDLRTLPLLGAQPEAPQMMAGGAGTPVLAAAPGQTPMMAPPSGPPGMPPGPPGPPQPAPGNPPPGMGRAA